MFCICSIQKIYNSHVRTAGNLTVILTWQWADFLACSTCIYWLQNYWQMPRDNTYQAVTKQLNEISNDRNLMSYSTLPGEFSTTWYIISLQVWKSIPIYYNGLSVLLSQGMFLKSELGSDLEWGLWIFPISDMLTRAVQFLFSHSTQLL